MNSWRDHYEIHPMADLFPLMDKQSLKDLAADIQENGLENPVILYSDYSNGRKQYLLDGRNRLDAMELAGMMILDKDNKLLDSVTGGISYTSMGRNPATVVISQNINRRHLTKKQKVELIAKIVETYVKPGKKGRPTKKGGRPENLYKKEVTKLAEESGISKITVDRVLYQNDVKPQNSPKTKKFYRLPVDLDDAIDKLIENYGRQELLKRLQEYKPSNQPTDNENNRKSKTG